MNLFDMILLNLMFLILSFAIASIFQVYESNFDHKKNNLYYDLAFITSFYLILKYGIHYNYFLTILFLNIPFLISVLRQRNIPLFLLFISIIVVYSIYYTNIIIFLVLEYVIYLIIYLIFQFKVECKRKNNYFLGIFLLGKGLSTILYNKVNMEVILILISFYISVFIILYFLNKMGKLLQVSSSIKQLEEEKNIRTSLFKITHEIKNPIAVCNGYLQMYDVNNLEHSRKYIPIIKSEIGKVLVLLEDFLSITKIKLQKDIIDIYYLLEEVTDSLKPILKEKKIKYQFDIPDSELYMEADYNRLHQVFINLIKNSIEAIGTNGEIGLCVKVNQKYISIILRDNGCGISDEDLKRMNEPFFTTKQNGTGLGVFLSREIIKAHNGKIEYQSSLGKSTTVEVKLPLKKNINYF